jgi:septal ring factor EnvC (AmiA/AmiB activator)
MRKIERRLRERIRKLEAELKETEDDRQKFRDGLVHDLKQAIRLHGQGKYWDMQAQIERFSKRLQSVKYFYW